MTLNQKSGLSRLSNPPASSRWWFSTLSVDPHPHFKREGRDLFVELPVSVSQASLGAKVNVPSPEGMRSLAIPPGVSSGQKLRIKGQGVQSSDDHPAGDLYVILKIVVPDNIDDSNNCSTQQEEVDPALDPLTACAEPAGEAAALYLYTRVASPISRIKDANDLLSPGQEPAAEAIAPVLPGTVVNDQPDSNDHQSFDTTESHAHEVRGASVETMPQFPAGRAEARAKLRLQIARSIGEFVVEHDLGRVLVRKTQRPSKRLRTADLGYMSFASFPRDFHDPNSIDSPPELVFEICSPGEPWRIMLARVVAHFEAGVSQVGIVDMDAQTVRLYSAAQPESVFTADQELDLSPALPGFRVSVRELLSTL